MCIRASFPRSLEPTFHGPPPNKMRKMEIRRMIFFVLGELIRMTLLGGRKCFPTTVPKTQSTF